jgi:hypothetical protein
MNHDSRSFEDDLSLLKADVAVIRSNYVTKADLQEVRIELKSEIQAVRSELKSEIQAVRSDLKADIETVRAELGSGKSESKQDKAVLRQDLIELRGDTQANFEKSRAEMHAMGEKYSAAIAAQTWEIVGFAAALVVASHLAARAGF